MIGQYYMADEGLLKEIINGGMDANTLLFSEDYNQSLDIGHCWNIIHSTLTSGVSELAEDPLNYVVLGGDQLFESDTELVPHYLAVEQVQCAADAIEPITKDWFRQRFTVDALLEIGECPVQDISEQLFEEVWIRFINIQLFFMSASNQNKCIVFFLI